MLQCLLTRRLFCLSDDVKSTHSKRVFYRATAVQSPPTSCSFRALLEEEENRLIRAGQTGVQRSRSTQGSPIAVAPASRRVTFKCNESSEPERPSGWVTGTGCHNRADLLRAILLFSTRWRCWHAFMLPFKKICNTHTNHINWRVIQC